MSKILAILLFACLVGTAGATTWNDSSVIYFSDIAKNAGDFSATADHAKMLYEHHMIGYSTYKLAIETANSQIRLYNYCLKLAFNETIQNLKKMPEFSI